MNEPSGMRTPCSSVEANIGCRTSTPRSCAARAHGVQCMPVTAITLPGGSPWRTRASTPAIAAVRAGRSKSSSTQSRFAPGHPDRVGDVGDLVEQLHRGDARADDDHPLPGELVGRHVVGDMQLATAEPFDPG